MLKILDMQRRLEKKTTQSSFMSSSWDMILVAVDNKIIKCGISEALLMGAREKREKSERFCESLTFFYDFMIRAAIFRS